MTVLHISPSYKPAYKYGGPIISVSQLCENLAKQGLSLDVATTTANGQEELKVPIAQVMEIEGVSIRYFSRIVGDHIHFSPGLLIWVLWNCRKYDVIHIHSWWNLVSVFSVLACWIRSVRPILSPRGMLSNYSISKSHSKKLIHHNIGKWLLSKTVLHATSELEADDGRKLISQWRYFIAPNIIELPCRTALPTKGCIPDIKCLRMIFLSRIDPKKGLEFLLEALTRVSFPWKLSIVGEGVEAYTNDLKQMTEDLGIGKNIVWPGWASADLKYQYLRDSDLFVLTSFNENFANSVLESLAIGTPVLLSEHVGMKEYVQKRDLGWICTLNVENIVELLENIYQDQEKRVRIRKNGPAMVYTDFDASRIARQYLVDYEKYLSR